MRRRGVVNMAHPTISVSPSSPSSSVTSSPPPPPPSSSSSLSDHFKRRRRAKTQAERDAAKEERADRNRKAAQASRDKKRKQMEEMEETMDGLTSRNVQLEAENTQLNQRVQMLEEDYLVKSTEMLQLQSDLVMLRNLVAAMQQQQPQQQEQLTVSTNHHSARMMDQQCLVEACARATTISVMVLFHIMKTMVLLHIQNLWRTWAYLLMSQCAKEGTKYQLWTSSALRQQTPAAVYSLEMARLMDYCLAVDLATTFGKETAFGLLPQRGTRRLMSGDDDDDDDDDDDTMDDSMDMDFRDCSI